MYDRIPDLVTAVKHFFNRFDYIHADFLVTNFYRILEYNCFETRYVSNLKPVSILQLMFYLYTIHEIKAIQYGCLPY